MADSLFPHIPDMPFEHNGSNEGPRPDTGEPTAQTEAEQIAVLSAEIADLREENATLWDQLSDTVQAMRGIESDDIEIEFDPASKRARWRLKQEEGVEQEEEVAAEYPLSVYLDSGQIKVRPGWFVWTAALPSEDVEAWDPTDSSKGGTDFSGTPIPGSGFKVISVKLEIDTILTDDSAEGHLSIDVSASASADHAQTIYEQNVSLSGGTTLLRYWPLATVSDTGKIVHHHVGGDILELRQG